MNVVGGAITATSLVALAAIILTLYEAFKKPEEEYEAPIGDKPEEDEKEKEDREEKERKYATKALGRDCGEDSQCSATGKFGGRPAGALDRIHCDRGRCEYDRKDYTDVFWYPPSKCVGKLFGQPDTCKESDEEKILREKLKREGEYESYTSIKNTSTY